MRVVPAADVATALRAVPGTPRVVVSGNFGTPRHLVDLADASMARCRIFVLNSQVTLPDREGVVVETPFLGPTSRHRGRVEYLPTRLSLVPRLFTSLRAPDVVLVTTSTPRNGMVSLGIEVNILPAAIEAVRRRGGIVVAQLNSSMPYTLGDSELDVDDIDLALEADEPLLVVPHGQIDANCDEIAARVASYAHDACTVQFGIGTIPDAVCRHLRGLRGLGVWSEMISDGVVQLEHDGVLDDARTIVATFLIGSEELYSWVDANERVRVLRTERVNDPASIAANPAMLAVNAALEVDLYAQCNASYVRGQIYSGFGGQPDFVTGALHAPGGHAIVAVRSWHDGTDSSTIVPMLAAPATSFQHSVVVTEHGQAELFGQSHVSQAGRLIGVADPRAREELATAAARMFGVDVTRHARHST